MTSVAPDAQAEKDGGATGARPRRNVPLRKYGALAVVLTVVFLITVRHITLGEFDYNVDETQHAVTGLYVRDFLAHAPLAHPVQFTFAYYAQYPALSGVVHWPPFFYFVEGLVFLLLGPTVVTARLTVLLFALTGACFCFRLVRELQDEWTALAVTLALFLLPFVLLLEKSVMLDIPCLALSMASTYYWVDYLRSLRPRSAYIAALYAGLALLTKHNAVYLPVFFVMTLVMTRRWRLLFTKPLIKAAALGGLLAGPYYLVLYLVTWQSIGRFVSGTSTGPSRVARFLYYPAALPEQVGWPILFLSVVGILTRRWWVKTDTLAIILALIFSCYITFTLIGYKDPRYTLYWTPAFVLLAVGPLCAQYGSAAARFASRAAVVLLLAFSLYQGWQFRRPYVAGYEAVAREITSHHQECSFVLFDGALPGNFIYFMRASDPERRFVVLRKALWVTNIIASAGEQELIHSRAELEDLLRTYGVHYIVVDNSLPLLPVQTLLRTELKSDQFQLVRSFPVESNMRDWAGRKLLLYVNRKASRPTAKEVRIKMLTMGHDIVVPTDAVLHGCIDR